MTSLRHISSGNARLGILLALTTTLLWGFLSIALKFLLGSMDGYTITWYRLAASALILGVYQAKRRRLPAIGKLAGSGWWMLAIALVGLLGNYVLFVLALGFVPPATAQLVIQLAPVLFMLGALLIFREPFGRLQWTGLALLVVGLLIFFNDRIPALLRLTGEEALGVSLVVVAGVIWAGYALAQKQLLVTLSSVNILLLIYAGSTVVLLPLASPLQITALSSFELALLAFCTFNTLAAYGCFAEALEHTEASRVSAVIALTPMVTIAAVTAILWLEPEAAIGERPDAIGLVGALVVVVGSVMAAVAGGEKEPLVLE